MIRSIKLYENTDAFIMKNEVEWLGFDCNTSFGEIINLAMQNNCRLIVKNGNGKWYLKCAGKTYEEVKIKLDENIGRYPRLKSWLIEYVDDTA